MVGGRVRASGSLRPAHRSGWRAHAVVQACTHRRWLGPRGSGRSASALVNAASATPSGTASSFVPIVPCRLADTRVGDQHVGARAIALRAAEIVTFQVWNANGNCTIPTTATGIATNVTAVGPSADSYITIYPADANPRPTASNLNVTSTSPPTPNQVTVGLSATGAIAAYNNGGTVDLVIDIVGFYIPLQGAGTPGPTGGTLVLNGYSAVYNELVTESAGPNGCVDIHDTYEAFLDLPLSAGAKITSVTANYRDINAGILFFELVYVSSPGVTEVVVSSGPQLSVNNLTGLSLVMNPHPPVADTARYDLSALAGSGGVQQFCGAVVTCCAPVPAQPHASAAAHDEALWWLRLTSPSPNER